MTKAVRKKIGLVGLLLCFVSVALSQEGLNDARSMCRDMTDKNRAMAQAAGYDVDRLCRGVNSISTDTVIDPSDEIAPPASRRTISSSAKFIKGQIDGELDNPETDSAEDFPWVWNAETELWEEKEEELKNR